MKEFIPKVQDRKVEYIELIYDLIFVYLVGRNCSLLYTTAVGFIIPLDYFSYMTSTMVALQIWYLSSIYINHYGDGVHGETIGPAPAENNIPGRLCAGVLHLSSDDPAVFKIFRRKAPARIPEICDRCCSLYCSGPSGLPMGYGRHSAYGCIYLQAAV